MELPVTTKVAGTTYGDAQENIKRFGCADIESFALVREPKNRYDPNAIKVEIAGLHLGYLPKHLAKDLAPKMDSGRSFLAFFVRRNESPYHETVGLTVKIAETTPKHNLQQMIFFWIQKINQIRRDRI